MKKDALIAALSIALTSAAWSVSCREGADRIPTGPAPSLHTPSVPAPSDDHKASVSGLVFEGRPQGDRPIVSIGNHESSPDPHGNHRIRLSPRL